MRSLLQHLFLFATVFFTFTGTCGATHDERKLTLTSPEFINHGRYPIRCAQEGENVSPEFFWTGAPEGTKSFVLVCQDFDDIHGKVAHWIVYNIPPTIDHLAPGLGRCNVLPMGAFQGMNDLKHIGYDGPKAKIGNKRHYVFTLYALDSELPLKPCCTYEKLHCVMQSYILAHATMTGHYKYQEKLQNQAPSPYGLMSDYENAIDY